MSDVLRLTARVALGLALCSLLAPAAQALAEDEPPAKAAKAARADAPKSTELRASKRNRVPRVEKKEPAKVDCHSTATTPEVAHGEALPKWACEGATVTVPDIWSGNSITAKWVVQNEGKADLNITIKGG